MTVTIPDKMNNVVWFVASGPTPSHLVDVGVFNRLKDAREHVASLPEKPTGGERPYRITRRDFRKMHTEPDKLIETNI